MNTKTPTRFIFLGFIFGVFTAFIGARFVSRSIAKSPPSPDNLLSTQRVEPLTENYGQTFRHMTLAICILGLLLSSLAVWLRSRTAVFDFRLRIMVFLDALFLLSLPFWANSVCRMITSFYPTLRNFVSASSDRLHEWFELQMENLFKWNRLVFSAIGVALLGLCVMSQQQVGHLSPPERILLYVALTFVFAACGPGGYILWRLIVFFQRLPELDIRVFLNQDPFTSVRAVETLSIKLVAWWSWFALIIALAILASPFASNPLVAIWTPLGFAPALLLLVSQKGIHQAMVREKKIWLGRFSRNLELALNKVAEEPTVENISRGMCQAS